VVGTETPLEARVEVGGDVVVLRGYADRLELDSAGRVVVVDFKTTKNPPPDGRLADNAQLGLYQLAVARGAADRALGRPGEPGGAELVQLRKSTRGSAKVQRQEPQSADESGRHPVEAQLEEAVRLLRTEEFPARMGEHCRFCRFTSLCPHETSGTVLT